MDQGIVNELGGSWFKTHSLSACSGLGAQLHYETRVYFINMIQSLPWDSQITDKKNIRYPTLET